MIRKLNTVATYTTISHHKDIAGVQAVPTKTPGQVFVGDAGLFSFLESNHAGDRYALDSFDLLFA